MNHEQSEIGRRKRGTSLPVTRMAAIKEGRRKKGVVLPYLNLVSQNQRKLGRRKQEAILPVTWMA